MTIVRMGNNKVVEMIPQDELPVEEWYGADFAKLCIETPDEVELGWRYTRETNCFAPASEENKMQLAEEHADLDERLDTIEAYIVDNEFQKPMEEWEEA